MSPRVAVLASGSGSNLQALPDAPGRIALVISNRRDAFALERARQAGIPALHLPRSRQEARPDYDARLVEALQAQQIDWVCLAGWMLLVTPLFLRAFPNRVLNVHPALLPSFPGLDGAAQALAHGARITGATVHLVDEGCDTGPILCQGAVPILPDDDLARLQARIHRAEHRIYPRALRLVLQGQPRIEGRRVLFEALPQARTYEWIDS
jgi:phosphoribosylglycinamide formyltransferase 1